MIRTYLVIAAAIFCFYSQSLAQSQGPNSPTDASASGTGASFANLTGLYANDNNAAYSDLAAYPTCISSFLCYHSQEAIITHFGFSIPLNATVTGVKVEIRKKVSQPVTTIHDSIVQLVINSVPVGLNLSSTNQWQMPFTYETYGDSVNLWGAAITPADINSVLFGLRLMLSNGNIDQTAQVDHVRMTVYYTTSSGLFPLNDDKSVSVFQNNGQLVITNNSKEKLLQTILTDQSGRVIATNNSGNHLIELNGAGGGIYFVQMQFASGMVTRKVFIP